MSLSIAPKKHKPPRILIYGTPKIGKSTFGSLADNPIFVPTEEGLDNIDCPSFPVSKSFAEIMDYLGELAEKPHEYRTVVIDSLDHLEPLIWKQTLHDNPRDSKGRVVNNIEDYGFGTGYRLAVDIWEKYIAVLEYLRDELGMTIIQIAHAEVKRFENPVTEGYDRYQVKLQKLAAALIMEESDIILFVNYFVGTTKSKNGFNERVRATGSGERILYTEDRPSFIAGNRYSLPDEIPFDKDGGYWGVLAQHVPFYNQPTTKVSEGK